VGGGSDPALGAYPATVAAGLTRVLGPALVGLYLHGSAAMGGWSAEHSDVDLLGVVARAADGWNVVWSMTPDDYRGRLGVLEAACQRAGREPGEVRRSLGLNTLIGRDADDLVERWRRLQAWTPGGSLDGVELRDWAASRLVGTPEEILAQLRGWEELGIEQVVCTFAGLPFALFEDEQLELAAELVLPRL